MTAASRQGAILGVVAVVAVVAGLIWFVSQDEATPQDLDVIASNAGGHDEPPIFHRPPPDVPELGRIPAWSDAAKAAVHTLAHLRVSFAEETSDRFVQRLRDATLVEALEALPRVSSNVGTIGKQVDERAKRPRRCQELTASLAGLTERQERHQIRRGFPVPFARQLLCWSVFSRSQEALDLLEPSRVGGHWGLILGWRGRRRGSRFWGLRSESRR